MTYMLNKVAKRSMEVIEKDTIKRLPVLNCNPELLAVDKPDSLTTLLRLAQ